MPESEADFEAWWGCGALNGERGVKVPPWMSKIIADNDRDVSECDAWFDVATQEAMFVVWMAIQRETNSPTEETVLRLAQLAFGEAVIRKLKRDGDAI